MKTVGDVSYEAKRIFLRRKFEEMHDEDDLTLADYKIEGEGVILLGPGDDEELRLFCMTVPCRTWPSRRSRPSIYAGTGRIEHESDRRVANPDRADRQA